MRAVTPRPLARTLRHDPKRVLTSRSNMLYKVSGFRLRRRWGTSHVARDRWICSPLLRAWGASVWTCSFARGVYASSGGSRTWQRPRRGRTSYFTEAFQDIYRSSSGVTYCQQALAQWEHGPGNPTNGNGRWTARAFSKSYTSGSCRFNGTGSSQPRDEITSKLFLYVSSSYQGPTNGLCYTKAQSNASTATLVTTYHQADTPGQPCGYGYYYVQAESRVSWSIGDRYVYAENSETHHMPS